MIKFKVNISWDEFFEGEDEKELKAVIEIGNLKNLLGNYKVDLRKLIISECSKDLQNLKVNVEVTD